MEHTSSDAPLADQLGVVDAIRRRRMVRNFSGEPLDSAQLDRLLDRARQAPSAGNTSAATFVVLDRRDLIERYWGQTLPQGPKRERFSWPGLLQAPALVLVMTDPVRYPARYSEPDKRATGRGAGLERWPVPYWWVDAGAVIQNILLLAIDAGWGACMFGPFDHEDNLKVEFDLAPTERIVATIALGHPLADEPGRSTSRPRPTLDQVIRRP